MTSKTASVYRPCMKPNWLELWAMIVSLLIASFLIAHPYGVVSRGGGVVLCVLFARMAYLSRKIPDARRPGGQKRPGDVIGAVREAFRARAAALRDEAKGRILGDSADLIREDRDQR